MADNDSATLCANNCGFYANPNNQNLCSLCYANFLKPKLQHSIELQEPKLATRRSLWLSQISTDLVETRKPAADLNEPVDDLNKPAPKGQNRCKTCKKKVGLLGFKCRCGDSFCGKHRYPEEHSCAVDHKVIGKEILAKQIVECKADKLEFRV